MEAGAVYPHIEVIEDVLNDLPKGQRYNSQIVALKTENRHTDDHACNGSHNAAHDDGQQQTNRSAGHCILNAHGQYNTGKSAYAHKSGMAQAQFPQNTDCQVQAHRHTDVHTDGHQLTRQGVGELSARYEKLHDHKGNDHNAIGDHIAAGGFVEFFHPSHLTLSHGSSCPAGPQA